MNLQKLKSPVVSTPVEGESLYILQEWMLDKKRKPLPSGVGADGWFPVSGICTLRTVFATPQTIATVVADHLESQAKHAALCSSVLGPTSKTALRVRKVQVLSDEFFKG